MGQVASLSSLDPQAVQEVWPTYNTKPSLKPLMCKILQNPWCQLKSFCMLLPTCWQVGKWPSLARISSHSGEWLIQAKLSTTFSSTWVRCVTTARGSPASARSTSSITCHSTGEQLSKLKEAGLSLFSLSPIQLQDQMLNYPNKGAWLPLSTCTHRQIYTNCTHTIYIELTRWETHLPEVVWCHL